MKQIQILQKKTGNDETLTTTAKIILYSTQCWKPMPRSEQWSAWYTIQLVEISTTFKQLSLTHPRRVQLFNLTVQLRVQLTHVDHWPLVGFTQEFPALVRHCTSPHKQHVMSVIYITSNVNLSRLQATVPKLQKKTMRAAKVKTRQKRFRISNVAADWHELMIPQRIMRPSIACTGEQLDPRSSQHTYHHSISVTKPSPRTVHTDKGWQNVSTNNTERTPKKPAETENALITKLNY